MILHFKVYSSVEKNEDKKYARSTSDSNQFHSHNYNGFKCLMTTYYYATCARRFIVDL